ncbi:MAG: hypothetical protein WD716_09875 [Fimbriimonadaceae bacterium]
MNHNKLFALLAAVAVIAVGCAPETTSNSGGVVATDEVKPLDTSDPKNQPDPNLDTVGPLDKDGKPLSQKNGQVPQLGASGVSPGGSGGGGERRGGGGRGGGLAFLVRNEQIAKELGLTEDQVKKIAAAVPEGMRDMSDEDRAKAVTKLEADVKAVLTPAQNKRVSEIRLQMSGPRALTQPDVAKELGLSEDQVKKIEAALDVPRPEGGGMAPGGEQPSDEERAKRREEAMKAREAANAKALAVLTPDQQKKWDAMLGKKFEFQMQQGGGGPRSGGGITTRA